VKLGIDVQKFLSNWAIENSDELVEDIEQIIHNHSFSDEQKIKAVYTKTLNYVFGAITVTINENNKEIERQLRRAGVQLP
jgi:hypothetical protein